MRVSATGAEPLAHAEGDAAVGPEAGPAHRIAGDEEGGVAAAGEPLLEGAGAFGETERDRGVRAEPADRMAGDEPRGAGVLAGQALLGEPDLRLAGEIAAHRDRHQRRPGRRMAGRKAGLRAPCASGRCAGARFSARTRSAAKARE